MVTKVNNRMIDGASVNVMDFGAVGDGVTDDTAAIQAALATGAHVEFPAGVHMCSGATMAAVNNVVVSGGHLRAFDGHRMLTLTDCNNVTFTNMVFDTNSDVATKSSNTDPNVLLTDCKNIVITESTVTNNSASVTYGRFLRVANSPNCKVTDSYFEGWGSGTILFKDGSDRGIVSNNIFDDSAYLSDAGAHAVDAEGVLGVLNAITGVMILGNTFEAVGEAAQFTGGVYNSMFTGNVVRAFSANLGAGFKFDRCGARNVASNNQFYGDFLYGINCQDDGTGEGVYVLNNVFQTSSAVATDAMVRTADSTNSPTYIEGNSFYGVDDNGVNMAGCDNVHIKYNKFYSTNIAIRWADNTATSSGHVILGNYYEGDNTFISGSMDDCVIRQNTIKKTAGNHFIEINGQLSNTVIDGNLFNDSAFAAISVYNATGGVGGNVLTNNVRLGTNFGMTPVLEGNNL